MRRTKQAARSSGVVSDRCNNPPNPCNVLASSSVMLQPICLIFPLFQSWLLHVYCWIQKDGMKKVRSCKFYAKNERIQWTHPFLSANALLFSSYKQRWKGGRPELAGSNMAMLFSPDSSNSAMAAIQAGDISGRRKQWFFDHLRI